MQTPDATPFTSIYVGFDLMEVDMLERWLEAEGIVCHRIGTRHPAALGVGEFACEQRLEVAEVDAARAREVIKAAIADAGPEVGSRGATASE